MATKQARETVQSVERCLSVLEAIASSCEPVGVSALSRQVGLSKATAHRMCRTLVERDFLQQDSGSGRYSPGSRLLDVSSRLRGRIDLAVASRPVLQGMTVRGRENAFAATMVGEHDLLVYDEVLADRPSRSPSLLGRKMTPPPVPGGSPNQFHLDDGACVIYSTVTARKDEVLGAVGFCLCGPRSSPATDELGRECVLAAQVLSTLMAL